MLYTMCHRMVYSIEKVKWMAGNGKGANGTGDKIVIRFDDLSDLTEQRALEAARLLATKHGRRRQAIVAMLEAVYLHYEKTGELLSASQIGIAIANSGAGQAGAAAPAPARMREANQPTESMIAVSKSDAGGGGKKVVDNLLNSMIANNFFG